MAAEKDFENKIKKFLKDQGCWLVKYWSGKSYTGKKFTKDGIPDILCCCDGFFIGIEVKASNGKPSELQLYNLKKIDEAGGYGVLLYPDEWELFKNFILCIKADDEINTLYNYEVLKERWTSYGTQ